MKLLTNNITYTGAAVLVIVSMATSILLWLAYLTGEPYTLNVNEIVTDINTEMAAIRELHGRLDDDNDGQVDSEESEEFVREELSAPHSTEKSQKFHKEEILVSSEELWNTWSASSAHNWSCDQVAQWLTTVVEIPDLVPLFKQRGITGRSLPLIAANSGQFLSTLNISKHSRSKLQIKAMDLVLFGPPPTFDSYWKDSIVIISVTLCILGLSYAWRKQSHAHSKIDRFLEEIRDYETELQSLRNINRLNSEDSSVGGTRENPLINSRTNSQASDCCHGNSIDEGDEPAPPTRQLSTTSDPMGADPSPLAESPVRGRSYSCADAHENESLKLRVWELESRLEASTSNRIVLKSLLQEACHSEWTHLETMRVTAEKEVVKAQKVCDKIKHKRSSVIGAFRLANSSTLEDAGLQITRAVNKMHNISASFQQYHSRWKKIEKVSQFSLSITAHSSPSLSNNHTHSMGGSRHSITSSFERILESAGKDQLFVRTVSAESLEDSDGIRSSVGGANTEGSHGNKSWHVGSFVEGLGMIEEEGRVVPLRTGSEIINGVEHDDCESINNPRPFKTGSELGGVEGDQPIRRGRTLNGLKKSLKLRNN